MLLQSLLFSAACLQGVRTAKFPYPSAPLLPIAPIADYNPLPPPSPLSRASCPACAAHSAHSPPASNALLPSSSGGSSDPCRPSPCGPNTRCTVNKNNIAQCRCLANFKPDRHTINGCIPQCVRDIDCGPGSRCLAGVNKCARICDTNTCGIDAICTPQRSRPVCSCPDGFEGNPDISCTRQRQQDPPAPSNPCELRPCGAHATCTPDGRRAICSCEGRYEGDGIQGCRRSECIENSDCGSGSLFCKQRRCVNPCSSPGVCGRNADCTPRDHHPICSCAHGYVGDPFTECTRFDPATLCQPDTCGRNADCEVRDRIQPVCTCKKNFIGDPLTACRPECTHDADCRDRHRNRNYVCQQDRCVNPCAGSPCGTNAQCSVENGAAKCSCPEYYQGNPHHRCYLECQKHSDCGRSYHVCGQNFKCVNPCDTEGVCGKDALCRVENRKPICSCPKDHKGHPFEACIPFTREDLCRPNPCGSNAVCTPGYDQAGNDRPVCTCPAGYVGDSLRACVRGECEKPSDCPSQRHTCHNYSCKNPCYDSNGRSVCGDNTSCSVVRRIATCACRPGYGGDARHGCTRRNPVPRYTVGRSGMGVW